MTEATPTAGDYGPAETQADVDSMGTSFNERAADGSLCGRRGLYEHHFRVLRQARARLVAADASAAPA
jgi:hypothetical protein